VSQSLKSTGPILSANLPAILVSVSTIVCTGSVALADTVSNSTMIPLQHVRDEDDEQRPITWLGTMVGINNGSPRLYMFDTGSDQFNAQIAPDTTGVTPVPGAKPQAYAYGDGTYANWVQRVQFDSLSYYGPKDRSAPVATYGGGYQAAKVLDILFTAGFPDFKEKKLSEEPVGDSTETAIGTTPIWRFVTESETISLENSHRSTGFLAPAIFSSIPPRQAAPSAAARRAATSFRPITSLRPTRVLRSRQRPDALPA
jgi:hypothetical protein